MPDRARDVVSFYELLGNLAEKIHGPLRVAECTGRLSWPVRGVYFFFEEGEERAHSGNGLRVVRVGTHGLTARARTKLWNRLAQHRGTVRGGGGNHRGSIFRLLVGEALIARHGHECRTWGERGAAPRDVRAGEVALEQHVSATIAGMRLLVLAVDDESGPQSLRGYIERNAIALLSNSGKPPMDPASSGWLGRESARPHVKDSHLWNQNHVDDAYDPNFLIEFERCIARTEPVR